MSAYSRWLEQIALPLYYGLRSRSYGQHRAFLERSQWWSIEQLRRFQWQELRRLLEVAFLHVPHYRRKYTEAGAKLGDIRGLEDFARLPPLTRDEVRQFLPDLCSTIYRGRLYPHATGGSTGRPTRFWITLESYDWRCAASARAYSWSGCRLGERTLYLWGAPMQPLGPLTAAKTRLFHVLRRELIFNTFSQTPEFWETVRRKAVAFAPRYVVGYVSSLEGFCRYLLASGKRLAGIRAVLAAAEPVLPATRLLVQQALGAPLFNTYGSREFMSIAAECQFHNGLHINMENLLVETARSTSEGPSEILVTDLHNFGMPFLRYAVGDVGLLGGEACPCGRGLDLLKSVDGRVLDVLRTPSGRVVPGEFFPHLLKELPEVLEFQVRQPAPDRLELWLVLSAPLGEPSRGLLNSQIRRLFGPDMTVEIRPVGAIPRTPSGKRRVTIGLSDPT